MRKICLAVLLVMGSMTAMFAQSTIESMKVSRSFLRRAAPRTGHAKDSFAAIGRNKKAAGISTAAAIAGIPGVDSLVNWSDQFTAPGFDFNGNAQSVWPYTMVGTAPETGKAVTINAPIVRVTLDLLGPDGTRRPIMAFR